MTVKEAQRRLEAVREVVGDDEKAHSREDELHRDVLQHIALGGRNGAALARIALQTRELDFARWCA